MSQDQTIILVPLHLSLKKSQLGFEFNTPNTVYRERSALLEAFILLPDCFMGNLDN